MELKTYPNSGLVSKKWIKPPHILLVYMLEIWYHVVMEVWEFWNSKHERIQKFSPNNLKSSYKHKPFNFLSYVHGIHRENQLGDINEPR